MRSRARKPKPEAAQFPPALLLRPSERRAHWAHANRQLRRQPGTLAETLSAMLAGGLERRLRQQAQIADLLASHLPTELRAELGLGSLHRGTLTLMVAAGAWAFHFDRRLADALAECFAQAAPDLGIRRVRFKVGECSDPPGWKIEGGKTSGQL